MISPRPPLDPPLHAILTSRVYDVARERPLDPAPRLSRRLGNAERFKREDQQPVFSFKLRGAYNKIAHLTAEEALAAAQYPIAAVFVPVGGGGLIAGLNSRPNIAPKSEQ